MQFRLLVRNHYALPSIDSTTTTSGAWFENSSIYMQERHSWQRQLQHYPQRRSSVRNLFRNDRPVVLSENKNMNHQNNNYDSHTSTTYDDEQERNRTRGTVTIIVTLMILYIGFCFFYHKKRATVTEEDDGDESDLNHGRPLSRREQYRRNQNVLDESNGVVRRAQANAEAMIKYQQRKMNIEKALFIRIIVDDDDNDAGTGNNNNRNAGWLEEHLGKEDDADATSRESIGDILSSRKVGVIVQEDDSDVDDDEEVPSRPDSTTTTTSLETQDDAAFRGADSSKEQDVVSVHDAPSNVPKIATVPDDSHLDGNCLSGVHPSTHSCSLQRLTSGCTSNGHTQPHTIAYSEMCSKYDDECNICLIPFQVYDSVAWNMQYFGQMHGVPTFHLIEGNKDKNNNNKNDVCQHAFHEVCISRWLLVRDGCPVCRQSYFPVKSSSSETDMDTIIDSEMDVEQGL